MRRKERRTSVGANDLPSCDGWAERGTRRTPTVLISGVLLEQRAFGELQLIVQHIEESVADSERLLDEGSDRGFHAGIDG